MSFICPCSEMSVSRKLCYGVPAEMQWSVKNLFWILWTGQAAQLRSWKILLLGKFYFHNSSKHILINNTLFPVYVIYVSVTYLIKHCIFILKCIIQTRPDSNLQLVIDDQRSGSWNSGLLHLWVPVKFSKVIELQSQIIQG